MFEKEAEEYASGLTYPKFQDNQIANIVLRDVEGGFQKGAEVGYNKANEWHYVKDGDLPKDENDVLVYSGEEWRMCVGRYSPKHKAWEAGCDAIAWKEIVLPKESE